MSAEIIQVDFSASREKPEVQRTVSTEPEPNFRRPVAWYVIEIVTLTVLVGCAHLLMRWIWS